MGKRRVALALGVLAALGWLLAAGAASGERSQRGNLVVSLNGGITPRVLPRDRPTPVAVHLDGKISTADGSTLPQVKQVKVEVAGHGLLDTDGLAVCPRGRLRNSNDQQALERCGPALVGGGSLAAQVLIPHQAPFAIHARLLAFNGRTTGGRTAIWVHAFSPDPPISLVLPFVVRHGTDDFPTSLVAAVPAELGPLPRLAVFHLRLYRRFTYRGERHSYISATCPVPPSFTAGFLAFARATYSFAGSRELQVESVRGCRASR